MKSGKEQLKHSTSLYHITRSVYAVGMAEHHPINTEAPFAALYNARVHPGAIQTLNTPA
jgi:hypothetical protein